MAVTKTKKTASTEGIPPKVIKIAEELSCDLNDVEWNNRAKELADAHRETIAMSERKKSVMAELNADLKIAEAKETKLANIVATRSERRDVTVEVKYDYELGTVAKTRTDTGEIVSEREMTDDERQAELDLVDANNFIESRHEEA
jgi:hypothetical protein